MTIKPLADRIVVKVLEAEDETKGGLVLPDTAKEKPQQGKVVAIGPGRLTDKGEVRPIDVKVGDKVLFSRFSGTEIKVDNEDVLILKEDDVLAIITK
ncbi:co-chaperone GroES [bacterium Unc6]|nr:co-chaperone GroES [bacterium Unc6]